MIVDKESWSLLKGLINIGPIPLIAGIMYWARLVASDEDLNMPRRKLVANVLFAMGLGWAAFGMSELFGVTPTVAGAIGVLVGCSGKDGYVLLMQSVNKRISR